MAQLLLFCLGSLQINCQGVSPVILTCFPEPTCRNGVGMFKPPSTFAIDCHSSLDANSESTACHKLAISLIVKWPSLPHHKALPPLFQLQPLRFPLILELQRMYYRRKC